MRGILQGRLHDLPRLQKSAERKSRRREIHQRRRQKIKVEDVAGLIEDTETKPFESDNKLYFVNYADKMNPAAQNKLLKTLEEPQKAVSIFLGVGSESAILDTVKSRTKK